MPTRKKFIAGNWKMNTTLESAKSLARGVAAGIGDAPEITIAVCPPFPWLIAVGEVLKGTSIGLGAQDCHFAKDGAYTGSVSPLMLVEAGCHYTIIGHSERRHGLGESDDVINKKLSSALIAGLRVILCIGELLTERQEGGTEAVLERQLTAGLAGIQPAQVANVVISYEPVWAIGGPTPATSEQVQAAHSFIRGKIRAMFGENVADSLLILYGGAVKPENAAGLLNLPDVDGALVGGASLKAESFLAIAGAVDR